MRGLRNCLLGNSTVSWDHGPSGPEIRRVVEPHELQAPALAVLPIGKVSDGFAHQVGVAPRQTLAERRQLRRVDRVTDVIRSVLAVDTEEAVRGGLGAAVATCWGDEEGLSEWSRDDGNQRNGGNMHDEDWDDESFLLFRRERQELDAKR